MASLQPLSRLDELKEPLVSVRPVIVNPVAGFPRGGIANPRSQVNVTVPSDPRSALYCSYCRKSGHDLAHCRRNANDHKYLKRGR